MISYLEIEEESIEQGVSPQTIEKDYHLNKLGRLQQRWYDSSR